MDGFRVDPTELTELAATIERADPFSALTDAARQVTIPGPTSPGTYAVERFTNRLLRAFADLSTATGSLVRATRSADAGYREVEVSIGRWAGG